MKKQASNAEIEDVLSSIRRLVSEDTRGSDGDGVFAAPDQSALVLTPQQRVGSEDAAEAGDDDASAEPMLLDNPLIVPEDGADSWGDKEESADDLSAMVEAEVAAAMGTSSEAHGDHPAEAPGVAPATDSEDTETPCELAGQGDTAPEADEDMPSLISELSRSFSEDESPTDTDDDSGQDDALVAWPEKGNEKSDASLTAAALHALHGHQSQEDYDERRSSHTLEDKIAELEAMISQAEDRPDTVSQRAEGDTIAGPWPARTRSEPAPLDDAALRALVADVVREELQGALGERITRNVRKLVRREIQRVLAARDFD